ncbi:6684_t:CDS:10 [Paraglomus occultum]|uniref:6684_t:CDS:1 n=1 Tax=Paraglomus occultum TaxID=144539 RepID=A0A9N8Z6V7_9GLOM|nr:6684_t:CDS:10 [Paraglomus occultum]
MTKPKSRTSYRYADARRSRKGVGSRKKTRRGRNASRNSKHIPISDVDGASAPLDPSLLYDDVVPREERSYTDIYTDLDVEESLDIVAPRVGRLTPPPELADPQLPTPSQPLLTQSELTRQSAPRSPSPSPRSRTPSPPPDTNIASPTPTPTPRRITPIFVAPPNRSPTAQAAIKRKILERIPKATFRSIEQDVDERPFIRPEGHYVKHEEPTEMDLAARVEYDMDEQDDYWLQEINEARKAMDLGEVTHNTFEAYIDRLEKEWFEATKNAPKSPAKSLLAEESVCSICEESDAENSNAIVFCDGCNLAVHQDCYGIPYIPEGQWLCRKCMVSPESPVSCVFCPNEGGAFKQTTSNQWAHLLCALYIPEVLVTNTVYMEPIDNVHAVPKARWLLTCYICKIKMGACIQCEDPKCFAAFHVTCGRKAKFYIKHKSPYNEPDQLGRHWAFCHKHGPAEYRTENKVEEHLEAVIKSFAELRGRKSRKPVEDDEYIPGNHYFASSDDDSDATYEPEASDSGYDNRNSSESDAEGGSGGEEKTSTRRANMSTKNNNPEQLVFVDESLDPKAARAYNWSYSTTTYEVPANIQALLVTLLNKQKGSLKKVKELARDISAYWSLKRRSRRGAPLLKRLHLEPWTASASALKQSEAERAKKYQSMRYLRTDLEKVRLLADLVARREKFKLRRIKVVRDYLEISFFPLYHLQREALSKIEAYDDDGFFARPVTLEEAPDYFDIIKHPMDFGTMRQKIDGHIYNNMEEFKQDINLIFENAMTYNAANTKYYRSARSIRIKAKDILDKAESDYASLQFIPNTQILKYSIRPEIASDVLGPLRPPSPEPGLIEKQSEPIEPPKPKRRRVNASASHIHPAVSPRTTRSQSRLAAEQAEIASAQAAGNEEKRLPKGWVYLSEEESSDKEAEAVSSASLDGVSDMDIVVSDTKHQAIDMKVNSDATDAIVENVNDSSERYPVGTLVWAKMTGFPWYPAEVVDPDSIEITPEILADRTSRDEYLVNFFDEKKGRKGRPRSWKWMPPSKLTLLSVDTEADLAKLRDKNMSPAMKKDIPLAYAAACAAGNVTPVALETYNASPKLSGRTLSRR